LVSSISKSIRFVFVIAKIFFAYNVPGLRIMFLGEKREGFEYRCQLMGKIRKIRG